MEAPLDVAERVKRAFDMASVGMVTTDLEGRCLEVNQQFSDMVGFGPEELQGMNLTDLTVSPLAPSEGNLRRLRAGEVESLVVEKKYRRKDGSVLDVEVTTRMVTDGSRPFLFTQVQDITERKRTEKKLRKKRTELSALISNLDGMVYRCLMDQKWTMLFLSDACEGITGYRPEDFLHNKVRSYSSVIYPDDSQRVRDTIMDAVRDGRGFLVRYRIVRPDGSVRWVMEQGSATRYDEDEPVNLEGYISDITGPLEMEQRYQRLLYDIPYGVAELTTGLEVLTMNPAFASMMGMPPVEERASPLLFPADNETEGLINRSIRLCQTQHSEFSRQGATFAITVIPPRSAMQRVTVQVILRDITELKLAAEGLAREEARLRMFLNSLDLFAYVKDSDLRYVMVNSSYARFLGRHESEILGQRHEDLGTDMVMVENLESDWRVLEEGVPLVFETTMHGRVLKIRKFPLDVRDGQRGVGALISDISVRKRMEDSDAFLHHLLSHDLKNKLTVIQGYHDLLRQVSDPDRRGRFLEAIEKASMDGVELIDKVEVLKRLSSTSETAPVNLGSALKRVQTQFHQRLEDAGMTMQVDHPSLDVTVQGGPLIHELFSNLVENCVLHSNGSLIRVSGEDQGDWMLCRLEDDGRGVEEADKTMIFNRGFRRGRKAGSGLGSYLAQRITEFYQAEIKAGDSELGGLCIDIRFRKG